MTQTIETTTQLETLKKVELGLAAFDEQKEIFTKLAESAALVDVTDFTDKAGLKVLTATRINLKNERVRVTKEGKGMRDIFTGINKHISSKENEIVSIIEPQEKRLAEREAWVESEIKRFEDEKIAAENERIQKMIDSLQQYGYELDYAELKSMSEETFQIALAGAKSEWDKEQAEIAEANRLEAEAEEQRKKAFEAEQKKIADDRAELETLRLQQAETAKLQKDAQDKIDCANKKIEDERAEIEAAKQRAIDEENAKEQKRIADEKAIEDQKQKEIADKNAADLKAIEDDRIAKEKEAERLANAPDKAKIQSYIANLMSVPVPELKTKKSKEIMFQIQELMTKVNDFSTKKVTEL